MRSSEPSYCRELNVPFLFAVLPTPLMLSTRSEPSAVDRDSGREPGGRDRARDLPVLARPADHRDRVVPAAGDVERLAVRREARPIGWLPSAASG